MFGNMARTFLPGFRKKLDYEGITRESGEQVCCSSDSSTSLCIESFGEVTDGLPELFYLYGEKWLEETG